MKKFLVTFAIVMTIGLGANAQSDGFFTSTYNEHGRETGVISETTPQLPKFDAPVGSGLLLLAGMSLAYAVKRKKD